MSLTIKQQQDLKDQNKKLAETNENLRIGLQRLSKELEDLKQVHFEANWQLARSKTQESYIVRSMEIVDQLNQNASIGYILGKIDFEEAHIDWKFCTENQPDQPGVAEMEAEESKILTPDNKIIT